MAAYDEDEFYDAEASMPYGVSPLLNSSGYEPPLNTSGYESSLNASGHYGTPCYGGGGMPSTSTPVGSGGCAPSQCQGGAVCGYAGTPERVERTGRRNPQNRMNQVVQMAQSRRILRYGNEEEAELPAVDANVSAIPPRFRRVPGYVSVLRQFDKEAFWNAVNDFIANEKWKPFEELPRPVQRMCSASNVGPRSFDNLPGFAPKWVFLLKPLNEPMFRYSVDYFFDRRKMPLWKHLPNIYVGMFELHNVEEFEFPD